MDNDSTPSIEVTVEEPEWHSIVTGPERFCADVIERCLAWLKPAAGTKWVISVLLTSDDVVQKLNLTHRSIDKPTNVLSFELADADEIARASGPVMLGDIVLAAQTIGREAKEQGKVPSDHLTHLLVHGTLHLFGYDHIEDDEAERMEDLERRFLRDLGIADPYAVADEAVP